MVVRGSLGLLVVIAATRVATAESDFTWHAPASCPSSADVEARIEARLPEEVRIRGLEVTITREGRRFVANIDMSAVTVGTQHRTLTSSRCDELADAVAVIVARLAAEAQRQRAAPVEASSVAPSIVAERRRNPLDSSPLGAVGHGAPPPPPPELSEWGGGVRVLAVSGIGMVSRVGVGGELAGFVRRHASFAELAVAGWADPPMSVAAGAQRGVVTAAQRGGWTTEQMPLRAWLGVELGSSGAGRWTAISAGFGVGWPMSRWSRLVGTFELAGAVQRSRVAFALAEQAETFQPAAASARCSLGLELGWR